VMDDPGIARAGMRIEEGGEVTSGTLSPTLGVAVGLGYVPAASAEPGTEITVDLRGRPRRAHIVPKPFYKREETR
jgi:aminomethyltransferase